MICTKRALSHVMFSFAIVACSSSPAGSDGGADGATSDASVDGANDAADGSDGASGSGLWVDPVLGSDANSGTQAFPLKTIKKAFTIAKSGDTVNLVPGTFGSSNGDDFSTPIPDGVSLAGTTPNGVFEVTLEGTSTSTLAFAGSGAVSSVWLKDFGAALTATSGTQTVTTVGWTGGGVSVSGSAQMTINGATGLDHESIGSVSNTAKLTINDGTFGDVDGIMTCSDTATFTAQSWTIGSVTSAFAFSGSCTASITKATINAGTAFALSGSPNVTLDTVDVTGTAIGATGGTISVKNGTFSGANSSTVSAITLANTALTINGLTIKNAARYAIEYTTGSVDATGLTVTSCGQGGLYAGGTLKLRSSTIKDDSMRGVRALASSSFDLGTTTDHGGNTFVGNSLTNVDISAMSNATVNAVGNTWYGSTQGADSAGHFGTGAMSGFSANGANFITSATAQLAL